MDGEGGGLRLLFLQRNGEGDVVGERVVRLLLNADAPVVAYVCRDFRGTVHQCSHSLVGCGIPEVLHQFRPSLVHVAQTAGIAIECAKYDVGVVVGRGELSPGECGSHLVGLLIVLPSVEVVGMLSGQCVVGHALQIVSPACLSRNLKDAFE